MNVSSVSNAWSYSSAVLPSEFEQFTAGGQQVQGIPYRGELIQVSPTARALQLDKTPAESARSLSQYLGAFGEVLSDYTYTARHIPQDLMARLGQSDKAVEPEPKADRLTAPPPRADTPSKRSQPAGFDAEKNSWQRPAGLAAQPWVGGGAGMGSLAAADSERSSTVNDARTPYGGGNAASSGNSVPFFTRTAQSAYQLSANGASTARPSVELTA